MTNNVPISAGSGTDIATDDVSSVHYQVVKLALGDEDSATRVTDANPLPVSIQSGDFTLTSGDNPLVVGSDTFIVQPTLTISASPAYSAGDVVGGRTTLSSAVGADTFSGVLNSVLVSWAGSVTPDLTIYFFDQQPTQNTADNAAFAWNSADDAKLLWLLTIDSADYHTIPGATTRTFGLLVPDGAPALVNAVGTPTTDLWMYVVTRSVFTAPSTSALRIKVGITRD